MRALLGKNFTFTSTGTLDMGFGVWGFVIALHEAFNLVSIACMPPTELSSQVYHIVHCSVVEDVKVTLSCVKF